MLLETYMFEFAHSAIAVAEAIEAAARRGVRVQVVVGGVGTAGELRGHLMEAIAKGRRVAPDAITRWSVVSRGLNWAAYALMRSALFVTGKRY